MATKQCPICGKEFGHDKSPDYLAKRTYCSNRCVGIANQRDGHPMYKERPLKFCQRCGKPIDLEKRFNDFSSKRYCSLICSNKARTKEPDTPCPICGTLFKAKGMGKRDGKQKYCSPECVRKAHSIRMYRGAIHTRRGSNWESQRRKVLQRDNNRCQICGRKQKQHEKRVIAVHHIIPFKKFNGDWKSANVLTNLITLCNKCHIDVEDRGMPCPKPLI